VGTRRTFLVDLVVRVDHTFVPFDDARAAFDLLADDLGLPVLWPFGSYGLLKTEAIILDNTCREALRSLLGAVPPGATVDEGTRAGASDWACSAGGPAADETIAELDRRGVEDSAPHPGPDLEEPMGAKVLLPELSSYRPYHADPPVSRSASANEGFPIGAARTAGLRWRRRRGRPGVVEWRSSS